MTFRAIRDPGIAPSAGNRRCRADPLYPRRRPPDLVRRGQPLRPPPDELQQLGAAIGLHRLDELLAPLVLLELGLEADELLQHADTTALLLTALAKDAAEALG